MSNRAIHARAGQHPGPWARPGCRLGLISRPFSRAHTGGAPALPFTEELCRAVHRLEHWFLNEPVARPSGICLYPPEVADWSAAAVLASIPPEPDHLAPAGGSLTWAGKGGPGASVTRVVRDQEDHRRRARFPSGV